ncbi:MAG: acyl--CoA ligase [Chloroflexi bacterium]|nr:acyl--CoA ligase [Chloroflexota bacterium]
MEEHEWQYQDIHTILSERAQRYPEKSFIISPDQGKSVTFEQACAWSNRVANFLKEQSVGTDEIIAIIGENSIETLLIYFGILNYGAIVAPINVEESRENIYRLLNLARPKIVFHGKEVGLDHSRYREASWVPYSYSGFEYNEESEFSNCLKEYSPVFQSSAQSKNASATLVFTSGTTAIPKSVVQTRESIYYMVVDFIDRLKITDRDIILDYRAYNWESSQNLSILPSLFTGATLVFGRRFSRSRFASWLKDYGVTVCIGVPTVINFLLEKEVPLHKGDVPALRFMTSSSAPLLVKNLLRFEKKYGIPINQLAGSSETNLIGINDPELLNQPEKRRIGSIGKAPLSKEVLILDEQGKRLGSGEEGEIVVKGKSVGLGYLGEDGRISRFPEDGFHTGDLGYIDSDGYIFITGRKKNLIIRGGVNISPMEVTTWLMENPAVHEAATIGVPDEVYGEEVASFIVPKEGYQISPEAIIDHCKKKLPDFKLPKTVFIIEKFPTGPTEKITRAGLLKIWEKKYRKNAK